LQGGPVHVAAGEAAVVVAVGQAGPALGGLAADEGLARLALGVQGVELLLQPLLGGLARVDGAADQRQRRTRLGVGRCLHRCPPLSAKRKKKNPLQWLPVTALATALSEG